jgi:hypothetical protein
MKIVQNLNYRQWQKRNSSVFYKLNKSEQTEAREKGYRNIGWDDVQKSWLILQELKPNIVSIFEHKLAKGDLVGAINLAIMNSDKTSEIATEAIATLEKNQQQLNKLAEDALNKYQPL